MDIQPADIVLVHEKGFNWLRLLTGMQYNHIFIIDDRLFNDWRIYESINKGTAPTLLSDYRGQELAGYRYRGITREQQEKVRYELAKMGRFKYDYFLPFRVIKKLGLCDTVKTLFKLWTKDYPLNCPHEQDKWVVCSEYAQEGYSRAGIPLDDDKHLMVPDSPLYPPMEDMLELTWHTNAYSGNPDADD